MHDEVAGSSGHARSAAAIIAAAAKPIENIDRISILDARGLHGDGTKDDAATGGQGNLADAAVDAAVRYRVGGPLIDGLMAELGMTGASLNARWRAAVARRGPRPMFR